MQAYALYCNAKVSHLSMLFTGFDMLRRAGELTYTVEIDPSNREKLPNALFLLAVCDGKRILFDMSDGYISDEELVAQLKTCDIYFKRSFSDERNRVFPEELRRKMFPLGFHFHVSCPGNPMDIGISLKRKVFQVLFNGAAPSYFTLDQFEAIPVPTQKPTVLFFTRLWDASCYKESDPAYYESVEKINADRIRLVTELRQAYGERFIGGIQFSHDALKRCPKLVAPIGATKRRNYLRKMHQAEICIGSTGLHDSIGWKTAEYVAGARAIVAETFRYQVTGNFTEGVNYLPFETVEECLIAVDKLMKHPDAIHAMQQANKAYCERYLRPDALVRNALEIIPGTPKGDRP